MSKLLVVLCLVVAVLSVVSAEVGNVKSHALVFHPELGPISVHELEKLSPFGKQMSELSRATGPPYTPSQVKAAYGFSTNSSFGAGMTIAIVDAYDNPTAESDLAVFSSTFGLPPCTTANKCFTKVNQNGAKSPLPVYNSGWAFEIALDVQWAHAIAPGAKILLVEAFSASYSDMIAAVNYAKSKARYVSMSWGGPEQSWSNSFYGYAFSTGQYFFASTGDSGSEVQFPAVNENVTAVGGTTLMYPGTSAQNETGWTGSGGGCSAYFPSGKYQKKYATYKTVGCAGKRGVPDVSSIADPNTGVYVYLSGSWYQVGGTSLAAPVLAARAAATKANWKAQNLYKATAVVPIRDITLGYNLANGVNPSHPCRVGYDLVTGLGSPIN